MSGLIELLNQPLNERIFDPRMYLGASHEVFGITLVITWAITLAFHPEQVFDHPARPIIGSFNPCFGWDYPPASYVALVCCRCASRVGFQAIAWGGAATQRSPSPRRRSEKNACHPLDNA